MLKKYYKTDFKFSPYLTKNVAPTWFNFALCQVLKSYIHLTYIYILAMCQMLESYILTYIIQLMTFNEVDTRIY